MVECFVQRQSLQEQDCVDRWRADYFYGPITRQDVMVINKVGSPIGSFFGLVTDGYFKDQADANAHLAVGNCAVGAGLTGVPCQSGAAPDASSLWIRTVTASSTIRIVRSSAVPIRTSRWVSALERTAAPWDASATIFGTFGNKIYDDQKEWYVFRNFQTNVLKDMLQNSWSPQNLNAKYPRLDIKRQLQRRAEHLLCRRWCIHATTERSDRLHAPRWRALSPRGPGLHPG